MLRAMPGKEQTWTRQIFREFAAASLHHPLRREGWSDSLFLMGFTLSAAVGVFIILASVERQPWYGLPVDQVVNVEERVSAFPER
jgi:hypothetical protein